MSAGLASIAVVEVPGRSLWADAWRKLKHNRAAMIHALTIAA